MDSRDDPVGPHAGNQLKRVVLDSGRGLVLAGAALVFVSTVGKPGEADGARAFLGLFLLLFGLCLLILSASAHHKIPRALCTGADIDGDLIL